MDTGLALSAAATAADPADPTSWAGLAKSIGSALGLFGGGGTYLSNSGYGWIGQVNKNGFTPEKSTAYTIVSDGTANNWAPGANASWHAVFDPLNAAFSRLFPQLGDREITIQARSGTTTAGLTSAIGNQLASIFSTTNMADSSTLPAPDLTGSPTPAGTPIANMGVSSGGSSTVAPSPTPTAANAAPAVGGGTFAGMPAWMAYLLLAYAAYHLWKGAGRG